MIEILKQLCCSGLPMCLDLRDLPRDFSSNCD